MSTSLHHWAAGVTALTIVGCASVPPAPPEALTPFELKSTISSAAGKPVMAKGFLQFTFENHTLWLDRHTSDDLRQDSCVGVSAPDGVDLALFHNKYVVIRGVVREVPAGVVYFNACGGAILEIAADAVPVPFAP
jgi:hypothetical protein